MDQKWYQDFVADENLNREMLFDLLTAANYMGIKPLLDLTCLKVTFQLTGKNAEEVSNIECNSINPEKSRNTHYVLATLDPANPEPSRAQPGGRSTSKGGAQVDL